MRILAAVLAVATVASATLLATPPASSAAEIVGLHPGKGPVGATVTVRGTGFEGATAVRVGGVRAGFVVEADDRISATIPSGAADGPVSVRTTEGTVTSTSSFRVLPNIVVVMSDDQRWDTLSGMRTVRRDIAGRGVTFANAFATNPLCCPSRATFLTGRYSHDTGVWTNEPPGGGFRAFDDDVTIATRLDAAGYATGMFGKYLNGYPATGGSYVPPGWDRWRAIARFGGYYDYAISLDGSGKEWHGSRPRDYSTDVLAAEAADFIRTTTRQAPLFVWLALVGPHEPHTPAPRHVDAYRGIDPWRPPSYDERDVSDKPAYIASLPRMDAERRKALDLVRRHQLEALLSVDDAVAKVEAALADTGRLGDTILVFTSDNGYAWGEHRREGKSVPYDESIRIPLVIRWDRVADSARLERSIVMNLDLPGSLVGAAGIRLPGDRGRNILRMLTRSPTTWRTGLLLEHDRAGAPAYCGIRTKGTMFVHYATGEEEYYRLETDRYELRNAIADVAWQNHIAYLRRMARERCRPRPPGMPAF